MANENVVIESVYEKLKDRMQMHHAICKYLGDNLSPETYMRVCAERGIEVPIISPAYGWKP